MHKTVKDQLIIATTTFFSSKIGITGRPSSLHRRENFKPENYFIITCLAAVIYCIYLSLFYINNSHQLIKLVNYKISTDESAANVFSYQTMTASLVIFSDTQM